MSAQVETKVETGLELTPEKEVKIEEMAKLGIILCSTKVIKGQQDRIKKTLGNLDEDIHANAVQCLTHAYVHRDTTPMRRLLVEIVGPDSGYRRQGLIAWMRTFSPMELKGTNIKLSGKDGKGEERPFLVEEAAKTKFMKDSRFAEKAIKPVYVDTILAPQLNAERKFREAWSNTGPDGKAINPNEPFFDGLHGDKVLNFFDAVKALRAELPRDDSKAIKGRSAANRSNIVPDSKANVGEGQKVA